MDIQRTDFLSFNEELHEYKDPTGNLYESVSQFLGRFKTPFDEKKISFYMAKAKAGKGAAYKDVKTVQEEILEGWEKKRDRSADYGTMIHEVVEFALRGKHIDYDEVRSAIALKTGVMIDVQKLKTAIDIMLDDYFQYYKVVPELRVHNEKYRKAGTVDIPLQRTKSTKTKKAVVDIDDLKTNLERGIEFDSIKREAKAWVKHYDRFMLHPLSHLEQSNYQVYCLQLSSYAYFIEQQYDVTIGRLAIRYIDKNFNWYLYPVPYMRSTVIDMLEYSDNVLQLPMVSKPEIISQPSLKPPRMFEGETSEF